jgi:hypothetical protein
MLSSMMTVLVRRSAELRTDERGEVNVSMMAWMVVAALVVFAFRTQLETMLSAAASFVTTTLGI